MIKIYGAGLAGLLCANMLRRFNPEIHEAKPSLPNNHSALLRFRTDKVGTACAIPFKKVKVQKAIFYGGKVYNQPSLFFSNMYSQKVTGSLLPRSINNLQNSERFIAPLNLIPQMANGCKIIYNSAFKTENLFLDSHLPIVSTMPMPVLMKLVDWKEVPKFPKQKIWTQRARIIDPDDCNVYQTIYFPDPLQSCYRVSIIGDVVISEHITEPTTNAGEHIFTTLQDCFGFKPNKLFNIENSFQEYGKILPIDEDLRKEFIYKMTTDYNIYSVGRFATWRQILLDDVVKDISIVEKFIECDSPNYNRLRKEIINES